MNSEIYTPLLRRPLPENKKSFLNTSSLKKKQSEIDDASAAQYLQQLSTKFEKCFPRRPVRKCFKNSCHKNQLNQYIDSTLIDATQVPNISIPQVEKKQELCSYPENHQSCTLNVLNIPEEDSLLGVSQKKPWRQILIEEEQSLKSTFFQQETSIKQPFYNIHDIVINFKYHNGVQASERFLDDFSKSKISKEDSFEIICPSPYMEKQEAKLHLRGHFLRSLPQLPLQVYPILTWINLSFNEFAEIPDQLFKAKNLICLNMRSNPLTVISSKISLLTKLSYINFSYCLLTDLNPSLFTLKKLEGLDVSFNHLTFIDPQISCLRSLHELYVDGNELYAFPYSILKLRLKFLLCNANYLHYLFWQEAVPVIPQSLVDISKMCLLDNNLLHLIPPKEQGVSKCEYCKGKFVGNGISVIKPVNEIFGVKQLPLLFRVCKESCRTNLLNASKLPSVNCRK